MIALDPNHFFGYWALGTGFAGAGAGVESVAALERAHELSGGIPFTLGFLAFAYGRAGRPDDARRLLADAERLATAGYVSPSTFALGYIGLEEWDSAFEWLDRAIGVCDPIAVPIKTYWFLDPVRDDARYRALLHKLNL